MAKAEVIQTRHRIWRWVGLGLLLLVLWFLAAPRVGAFESRNGETVVIGVDEVVDDDLYVTARTLTVEGAIEGDLVFFGEKVTVNGRVAGDLVAAGQQIVVEGEVGDDALVAAYAFEVIGDIGDDLVATGFSLHQVGDAAVNGDLLFAGYQALLEGTMAGDVSVAGGAVTLAGPVEGDVGVDVGDASPDDGSPMTYSFFPGAPTIPTVQPGFTLRESAEIQGDLTYTAEERVSMPEGVINGEVDFTRYVPKREPEQRRPRSPIAAFGRWVGRQAQRLATLLVIGLVLLWLAPDWMQNLKNTLAEKPLPSLGWGFVALAAFIVVMFAAVIATGLLALLIGAITLGGLAGNFLTLGGLVIGTAGLGFSVTWAYLTRVVVSFLLGDLILRLFNAQPGGRRWWAFILGLLIFVAVTAVPILGWILGVFAALLGLGALWLWGRDRLTASRARSTGSAEEVA